MVRPTRHIKVPVTFIEKIDNQIIEIEKQLHKRVTRRDILNAIANEMPTNPFTWSEYMFKRKRPL